MASPVVSVTPLGPLTIAAGARQQFDVTASDPDTRSGLVTFPVSDGQGNSTPVTVSVIVSDPLTYLPATTTITNATVTQDAVVPSRYYLQV